MLALVQKTDKIQVVLAGAVTTNQLQCFSSYRDALCSGIIPGRKLINTNNTTDVDIVDNPGESMQRMVDFLSIYNKDTASHTVTVKYDANGIEYILFKGILATGEQLQYTGLGFQVIASNGGIKSSESAITSIGMLNSKILAADVVNDNATPNTIADVTGLSFPVVSGETYSFEFVIPYTSAATTTGSRWSINAPATTLLNYHSQYVVDETTITVNNESVVDKPDACNASSLAAGNVAIIKGIIKPSANGTVIARFASEVASSAITAKAGAIVKWMRVL